eukprot:8932495-Ditylum_brightwellii.AAC.1
MKERLWEVTANWEDHAQVKKAVIKTLHCHVDILLCKLTTLNLLWWEWPPLHWDSLWEGIPVNFVTYPPQNLTPNLPMNEEQQDVAALFVDELLDLEALQELPPNMELRANGPLKVIPKPRQP